MTEKILTGVVLDEGAELTLSDLCRACSGSSTWVIELVEEGVLEPAGAERSSWRFSGTCLTRARLARRLQRDLDINVAGVALALELLEEIEVLRRRLSRVEVDGTG